MSKPLRRFVAETLQGIVGRQSVLLSEIARSLNEPIALIKTENRLSRNLRAIGHVSRACPERGVWVVDRGADRGELYNELVPPERKRRLIVSAYLLRWRVQAAIRFVKQSCALEDVRVRGYERLRNMTAMVTAAMYFTAVVLGTRIKLRILAARAMTAAKRFFGVPDFRYYAIADGIREILSRCPRPDPSPPEPPSPQLQLLPA